MPSASVTNSAGVPTPEAVANSALKQLRGLVHAEEAKRLPEDSPPAGPGERLNTILQEARKIAAETGSMLPEGITPRNDVSRK